MAKSASRNVYSDEGPAEGRRRTECQLCLSDAPRRRSGLAAVSHLRRARRAGSQCGEKLSRQEEENEVGGELEQRFPRGNGIHREAPGELDHPQEEKEPGRQVERRPENLQTTLPHAGNRPQKEQEKCHHRHRSPGPCLDSAKRQRRRQQSGNQEVRTKGVGRGSSQAASALPRASAGEAGKNRGVKREL